MRSNTSRKLVGLPTRKAPGFEEREDGLVVFVNAETIEEHAAFFVQVDGGQDSAQWSMAAIAASVAKKYGEDRVGDFAQAVGYSPRWIRTLARTYRWTAENGTGCAILDFRFRHYVEAVRYRDPRHALEVAIDRGFSPFALGEWVTEQNGKQAKPKRTKRVNEFREFLLNAKKVVAELKATCPNADWGRRVFKGWDEDIDWELTQVGHTETQECVGDAIDNGAVTLSDIKAKTGLTIKDIEIAVGVMVKEGTLDWSREGGEGDQSRGTRRSILHRTSEPCFT